MFTTLWTLCSSLCFLGAVIITKQSFATNSFEFIGVGIIVHCILLGLVQWKMLKPYIANAYNWGLTTIVCGIVCYFSLLILGSYLAFYIWLENSNINNLIRGRSSNSYNFWVVVIVIVVSLFISGFILGWMQRLVVQYSTNSVYITYLPIINGCSWLLCWPLFNLNVNFLLYFVSDDFYVLIISMFFCAVFSNLIKGLTIARILNI